jgi:hypothetical protein
VFPIHIGNYTIYNGNHARKEVYALQDVCLCTREPKFHDPHELLINHIISMGLTHYNIHVVGFEEYMFKGVLFCEEALQKLQNDAARHELEVEQKEMKQVTTDHFQRLPQEEHDNFRIKE